MEKNQVILTNVENFWDVSGLMCNIIGGERQCCSYLEVTIKMQCNQLSGASEVYYKHCSLAPFWSH